MRKEDAVRFSRIMAGMAEAFGVNISDAGLEVRFKILGEYSIEQVESACISILKTHTYSTMPTPAQIIEHINGGSLEDKGMVAATRVWAALKDHGSYATIQFDDPVLMFTIERGWGSWPKLCSEVMEDQRHWFIKEFARLYEAFARGGHGRTEPLPGIAGNKVVFIGKDSTTGVEPSRQSSATFPG